MRASFRLNCEGTFPDARSRGISSRRVRRLCARRVEFTTAFLGEKLLIKDSYRNLEDLRNRNSKWRLSTGDSATLGTDHIGKSHRLSKSDLIASESVLALLRESEPRRIRRHEARFPLLG